MQHLSAEKKPVQNITEMALAYMENKYGEPFEYVAPFGNSLSGTHELQVRSDSFPDQPINVRVENYRSEDRLFLDNYQAVKYEDETRSFWQARIFDYFGESNVYYRVSSQPQSSILEADASFHRFLMDRQTPQNVLVEVKESQLVNKNRAQQLATDIATYASSFYLFLLFVPDEDYGTRSREHLERQVVLGDYRALAKIVHVDGDIDIEWSKEE